MMRDATASLPSATNMFATTTTTAPVTTANATSTAYYNQQQQVFYLFFCKSFIDLSWLVLTCSDLSKDLVYLRTYSMIYLSPIAICSTAATAAATTTTPTTTNLLPTTTASTRSKIAGWTKTGLSNGLYVKRTGKYLYSSYHFTYIILVQSRFSIFHVD